MRLLLIGFLALGTGCSAILAATPGADLSKIEPGTPRPEIEKRLGKAKRETPHAHGTRAVYRVVLADPDAKRAAHNAATTGGLVAGTAATGALTWGRVFGNSSAAAKEFALIALPFAVGIDVVQTAQELGRRSRHEIEVSYDAGGRVVGWRFLEPEKVRDERVERSWARARARHGR